MTSKPIISAVFFPFSLSELTGVNSIGVDFTKIKQVMVIKIMEYKNGKNMVEMNSKSGI